MLGIGYLLLVIAVFTGQRKLLYVPDQFRPAQAQLEHDIAYWPNQTDYLGFISEPDTPKVQGTILLFHGNAGAAYHRLGYARALAARGYRVILVEYPGYGGRVGQLTEASLVADALVVIQQAATQFDDAPLYLWGESMGNGIVAAAVAQTTVPIKGLVLFTPWDSLTALAQTHYGYLPVRWMLLDKYDSVANLQPYQGNVAVLIGGQDQVIPPKHGQHLYDSLTTNKRLWLFAEAGHGLPTAPDLPWWDEVLAFVSQ